MNDGQTKQGSGDHTLDHGCDLDDLPCCSSDHSGDQLSGADSPADHGRDQLPDRMPELFHFEFCSILHFKSNCCYIRVVFILFYLF